MDERDERKRTSVEASKCFRWHQNRGLTTAPGKVWRKPTYWPCGVRCLGGVTLIRALVRNLRTCMAMAREKAQAAFRPLDSTCSMPSSSSVWTAETWSGSTSQQTRRLNG